MSDQKQQKGGKLLEAIDKIKDKEQKTLEYVLSLALAKRIGILESRPLRYDFEPGFADLIINSLADIIIHSDKKIKELIKEKILGEAFFRLFQTVKPEIDKLYNAISSVGFSSSIHNAEKKWKKAALEAFDDSKKGFKAIKREYLEDNNLYYFAGGQAKRDFEGKIFQKIIRDNGLGHYGSQLLRGIYKKSKIN